MRKATTHRSAYFVLTVGFAALLTVLSAATVLAQPYYQGKTIRLVVFGSPGGGNDVLARLVARYMPKHIPGNPGFVVQNMPGAAGMIATNYLYSLAKPDGRTIGLIAPGLYQAQLVGRPEVRFDWVRLGWIGTDETSVLVVVIRADAGYKSFEDIRAAREPIPCAETGVGSRNYAHIRLIEEVFGAKFQPVVGYKGAGEMNLALQRGEAVCRSLATTALLSSEPQRTWFETGFTRVVIQSGEERHPALRDVPTIWELAKKYNRPDDDGQLMTAVLAANDFGRPFVAPPGLPKDRLETLRKAFMDTMEDPEFLAVAGKAGLEVRPKDGAQLERLARDVMATRPEVIERLKSVLE